MTFSPRLRKLLLTAHVATSVGWVGAIAIFLSLAIAGLTVQDGVKVRAAYLAMDLTAWTVVVPLAAASLLSGIAQAVGTAWGLARHYWVLAKLLLTLIATAVLLMYTQTIASMATLAAETTALDEVRNPSPVLHAAGALLLLLAATVLAVYKPRGMTRYGWRRQAALRMSSQP